MNTISSFLTPVAFVIVTQLGVELCRVFSGRKPMPYSFYTCALSFVLFDLFAINFIMTEDISDYHYENMTNGLTLILVTLLCAVSFLPNAVRCFQWQWHEKHRMSAWVAGLQAIPFSGLCVMYLIHSEKVVGLGIMLWNTGW